MNQDLAGLLQFHRKRSGLTQQQLAELAGVGKNLVYELESGKTTVRWENLLRVLSVLNVRVEFRSPLTDLWEKERGGAAG